MRFHQLIAAILLANIPCIQTIQASPDQPLLKLQHDHVLCEFRKKKLPFGMSNLRKADKDAIKVVQWIADTIGMEANFSVTQASFKQSPIAIAYFQDGRRKITYDAELRFINDNGEISFDDVATIAHEMGHLLGGHFTKIRRSPHEQELEADRLAGFIIGKLGGTANQASDWTDKMNHKDTLTHPGRKKRKKAAQEGWRLAQKTTAREARVNCMNRWLSPTFTLHHQYCRIAWRCDQSPPASAMACQSLSGEWHWQ